MTRELVKQYAYQLDDSHTVGDTVSVTIVGGEMHLNIAGIPFTEERMTGDPNGQEFQKVKQSFVVPLVIPAGGAVEIELSEGGQVSIYRR